jgi:hypothetical protein
MVDMAPPYVQQRYQVMYLTIGGNLQTEVDSADIATTDGGEDIKTLVRGLAGRVGGAAMTTLNFTGSVPYLPTDTGGAGLQSGGMLQVGPNGPVQLDQTMLTNLNANSGAPVNILLSLGNPGAQTYSFSGQINSAKYSTSVGRRTQFSFSATGTFAIWLTQ